MSFEPRRSFAFNVLNVCPTSRTIKVRSEWEIDSFIKTCNHNKHAHQGNSFTVQTLRFARLDWRSGPQCRDTCAHIKHNAFNPAKNYQKQTVFIYTKSIVHAKKVPTSSHCQFNLSSFPNTRLFVNASLKLLDFSIYHSSVFSYHGNITRFKIALKYYLFLQF